MRTVPSTFRKLTGDAPIISLPKGAIDCHIHVFDNANFSGEEGGPNPPPDALVDHYRCVQEWLGIDRVVITQGNAYQTNNACILDAVSQLGDKARAVVAVKPSITEAELHQMTVQGARGARIMDLLQGAVGFDEILDVNAKINPFGWSMIVQYDGNSILEKMDTLKKLKGDYVIDHIGKFFQPITTESDEFKAILSLVDKGNCYVKIAGCYETSKAGYPDYEDVAPIAKAIIDYAPDRVIWGTNWPHNMAQSAETYPDDVHLLNLVNEWAGSSANRQKLFVDNPEKLYGFE